MSSRIRNTLDAGFTAFVVISAVITLAPTGASAFSLGGLGHMGGFGHMSGVSSFGHGGSLGHMSAGHSGKAVHGINADRTTGLHANRTSQHDNTASGKITVDKSNSKSASNTVHGTNADASYKQTRSDDRQQTQQTTDGRLKERTTDDSLKPTAPFDQLSDSMPLVPGFTPVPPRTRERIAGECKHECKLGQKDRCTLKDILVKPVGAPAGADKESVEKNLHRLELLHVAELVAAAIEIGSGTAKAAMEGGAAAAAELAGQSAAGGAQSGAAGGVNASAQKYVEKFHKLAQDTWGKAGAVSVELVVNYNLCVKTTCQWLTVRDEISVPQDPKTIKLPAMAGLEDSMGKGNWVGAYFDPSKADVAKYIQDAVKAVCN